MRRIVMLAAPERATRREALVLEHMELVRRIAHDMARRMPAHIDVDDLIQTGMVGLLEAAQRYEGSKGATFVAFAVSRIRGAMLDACRRADWSSRLMRRRVRTIEEATLRLESQAGHRASPAAIAQEIGISLESYFQVVREFSASVQMSLDQPLPIEGRSSLEPSDTAIGPAELAERVDILRAIDAAIDALPENERVICLLYYDGEFLMHEIGSMLDLSESRICQIHKRAIERVRAATLS